jgi:hypothetical protein
MTIKTTTFNPGDVIERTGGSISSEGMLNGKQYTVAEVFGPDDFQRVKVKEIEKFAYDADKFRLVARCVTVGGVTTAPRRLTLEELTVPSGTHPSLKAPKPLYDGHLLPEDSAERKTIPLFSVLFGYFPSAMVALANHSYKSNEKHNPGEDLHWSRGKSDDHQDAALRHLAEGDYLGLLWRAAALLQLELESKGAPKAPKAR